jgi:hypothetical protein
MIYKGKALLTSSGLQELLGLEDENADILITGISLNDNGYVDIQFVSDKKIDGVTFEGNF